jgi:hypothetical protein
MTVVTRAVPIARFGAVLVRFAGPVDEGLSQGAAGSGQEIASTMRYPAPSSVCTTPLPVKPAAR